MNANPPYPPRHTLGKMIPASPTDIILSHS